MNGHAKGCICQDCTIGREIGFDKVLELLRDLSRVNWSRVIDAVDYHYEGCDEEQEDINAGISRSLADAKERIDAFLSEHAEHDGVKE